MRDSLARDKAMSQVVLMHAGGACRLAGARSTLGPVLGVSRTSAASGGMLDSDLGLVSCCTT